MLTVFFGGVKDTVRSGRRRTRRRAALAVLCALLCVALCVIGVWRLGGLLPSGWLSGFGADQSAQDQIRDWDEAAAPNYYEVVGAATFDEELAPGEVVYEPLDALGRARGARACVDYALMETGRNREREAMNNLSPSGWGDNAEADIELPDGGTYHGYFWNRSHLLAKSLGGEEIIENLVCGTRMQNVGANVDGIEGGMAYAETLARDWLEENPWGSVQYAACPLYKGTELVCRNVVVDVRASDGTIDYEVLVFNAAKGYDIDYATGEYAME